jgi:aldose 1-epimerase
MLEKSPQYLTINKTEFGKLPNGQIVHLFTLKNSQGITVKLMNYGATIVSVQTPDKNGIFDEINLGFDTLEEYRKHEFYFGCIVGRVANRISHGRFTLNNKTYQLPINFIQQHHIHGGLNGFDKRVWQAEILESPEHTIKFSYTSQNGEEGYPGNLQVDVIYTLTNNNELKISYFATTDQPTPVDLTNHAYWNLAGAGKVDILKHELTVAAEKYINTDQNHIPSGEICKVANSAYDFRQPITIGARLNQLSNGYDLCYVLPQNNKKVRFAAEISDPDSGRRIEVYTNQNGLQFYTGNYLYDYPIAGNRTTKQFGGFCMETQNFPDAINHKNFPSSVLLPGQEYFHETIFKFI